MSQYIQKFQPGGYVTGTAQTAPVTTNTQQQEEQPIFFNTANEKYDARELAKIYEKNIPLFASHIGLKQGSRKYQQFLDEAAKIQQGLTAGGFSRGEGLKYTGTFLDDSNKMQQYGLGLLDKILETQSPYQEKKKEKEKYSFGNLKKFFWNKFYGGNEDADLQSWVDRDKVGEDGIRAVQNRATAFADMLDEYSNTLNDDSYDFQGSAFKDVNDYKSRLAAASAALRDGTFNNDDAVVLDQIGLGSSLRNMLFGDGSKEKQEETEADPDSYEAQLAAKKKELDADVKSGIITPEERDQALRDFAANYKDSKYGDAIYNRNYQNWANQHWGSYKGDAFEIKSQMDNKKWDDKIWAIWRGTDGTTEADVKPKWIDQGDNMQYALQLANDAMSGKQIDMNKIYNGLSNSNILRGIFYELQKDPNQTTKTKSGKYYINETFNYEEGTAVLYDPKTKTLKLVHVNPEQTPELLARFKQEYQKRNPRKASSTGEYVWAKGGKMNELAALRKGGIVKALTGAQLVAISDAMEEQKKAKRYARYAQEAQAKGMSFENVLKGKQKASNSGVSLLRNISTGIDVASGIASFIPLVGNAIGAVGGTIGTIGNLAADAMDDTVSSSEMYKNLALNAGMTGLMLVPGGGVVKAGKALVSGGAAALGAYNVLSNIDRIKELRAKADAGTLSHDERRELDAYYSMAAGAVTGAKGLSGQAAAKLGNNLGGKTAAFISDPILGLAATKNKKAATAFAGLTNSLAKTPKASGKDFNFVDQNGNEIKVTAKQKTAMQNAYKNAIKQDGATAETINKAVGQAWATAGGKEYAQVKHLDKIPWADAIDNGWLKASADPTSDLTLTLKDASGSDREITLSVADQKKIRSKFNDGLNSITEEKVMDEIGQHGKSYTDLTDAEKTIFDTKKLEMQDIAGTNQAKTAFESLTQTQSKDIDAGVNPNAPVVMPEGWTKKSGWKGWFQRNPQMGQFEDVMANISKEGYAYDPHSVEGLKNLRMRGKQRAADKAFLDQMKLGSLMNYFNTNWEMSHGMGALRSGSDKRLDEIISHRNKKTELAADPSSVVSRNAQFAEDFAKIQNDPAVAAYLQRQTTALGRPLTELEKISLAKEYVMGRVDDSGALIMNPKILEDVGFEGSSALAADRIQALREHYSKILNPDFDPATPVYSSDRDIALKLSSDLNSRGISSADLAEELIANKNLDNFVATYGGNPLDNAALEAAGINKKQALADYARNHGIAAVTDSNDIALNKLAVDPLNITNGNRELESLYSGVQTTNARNAWKSGEGAAFMREAESAGRTLSDVDVDLLRGQIDNNTRELENLINAERAAGRAVDPAQVAELKAIVDSYNTNYAKTGSTTGVLSTDLTSKLADLRAESKAITKYNNLLTRLGLSSDELDNIGSYIDTHEVPAWEAAGLSASEIAKRKRVRALQLGHDKMLNNKRIAAAEARRIAATKAAAEAQIESDLSSGLTVRDDATKTRVLDGIDSLSNEFADILPAGIADGMHDQINAYVLQELKNGTKIADIRTKFEHAAKSSSARNRLLDDIINADDTLEIKIYTPSSRHTTYTGISNSGKHYNWTESSIPNSTDANRNAITIDKIRTSGTVSDADVESLAKYLGFSDPVDLPRFKDFIRKTKKYKLSDFKDPDKIPEISRYFERAKYLDKFKFGGQLKKIKQLRANFTEDGIEIASIPSNKKGGILKAADGDKVIEKPSDWEWYNGLYNQTELGNPNLRTHNQNANAELNANAHNQNFNLGQAAAKNDAYTSTSDIVGDDLQRYYNSSYSNDNIDDYIKHYNDDAAKIRAFWGVQADGSRVDTAYNANTDRGQNIKDHNNLFRNMFWNRSQAKAPDGTNYNIGYQDNIDDVMGTSTWMRRMDRYKTEWDKDTEENQRSRVHQIKLKDGTIAYVYKKANGDIARLSDQDYQRLFPKPEQKPEPPKNPNGEIMGTSSGRDLDERYGIAGFWDGLNGKIDWKNPETLANINAFGRYLSNQRNNRRVTNEMLKQRTTLDNPLNEHRYVYGDYSAQQNAQKQAAQIQSQAGRAKTSDASLNIANSLQGASQAAQTQMAGNQQYNSRMYQTGEQQLALDQSIHRNNSQVQTRNNASLTEMFNNKLKQKASLFTANQTNLNTYLQELEYRQRLKAQEQKDLQTAYDNTMDEYQQQMAVQNDPEYKRLYQEYVDASNKSPEEYNKAYNNLKAYMNNQTQIKMNAYNEVARRRGVKVRDLASLRGSNPRTAASDFVASVKDGGSLKVTTKTDNSKIKREQKDQELLIKQIESSIATLEKSLDRLSKSQLLAIKRFLK